MPKVVVFDIDGTLVLTGGAGSRAMTRAFEEIFGIGEAFDAVPMAGRTDSLILSDALERARIPRDEHRLARFRQRYVAVLRDEIRRPVAKKKEVMPGVRELLAALERRADVFLALLTGNYAEAARVKLEYFDLWRYFVCGAFGDDASDRNHLVPLVLERAQACGAPPVTPRDVIVVGDTPLDVACAQAAGVRSVAVATGLFDVARLQASGADFVFADLSEIDAFLALLAS